MDKDISTINYSMYEGGTEYVGLVEVGLPSLEMITQTITGAGIAGELEVVLLGQLKAMQMTIKFQEIAKSSIKLAEPRVHNWELRSAMDALDENGNKKIKGIKHKIKAFPKQMNGGTLKPQSSSEPDLTAAVHRWEMYENGKEVLVIDPVKYICRVNGTDYLASVRKALGK